MLLVIALVLRLLDAILAFANHSDVDSIVFFFKAFLGGHVIFKGVQILYFGERDERQRGPTGRAKFVNANFDLK